MNQEFAGLSGTYVHSDKVAGHHHSTGKEGHIYLWAVSFFIVSQNILFANSEPGNEYLLSSIEHRRYNYRLAPVIFSNNSMPITSTKYWCDLSRWNNFLLIEKHLCLMWWNCKILSSYSHSHSLVYCVQAQMNCCPLSSVFFSYLSSLWPPSIC